MNIFQFRTVFIPICQFSRLFVAIFYESILSLCQLSWIICRFSDGLNIWQKTWGIYHSIWPVRTNKHKLWVCIGISFTSDFQVLPYHPALWCMHLYTKPRQCCMHQKWVQSVLFWLQKYRPISYIGACRDFATNVKQFSP